MGKRTLKEYFVVGLKGVAMGAADVVPGVSGGTIAFISGIYEELIDSISKVNLKTLKIFKEEGFVSMWAALNGNFLLSLVIGIAISFISLARLIKHLLENHPILIWSFFFGLVLASIIYVARQINKWRLGTIVLLVAGALTAYFITTLTPQDANPSYPYVFLSGALAICAMILPGISGSFILLLLGMYKPFLDAIHDRNVVFIMTLISGALVGLLSFSRILKWFFDHYANLTLAVLTGFILGSLNKIWPWKEVLETEIINGKTKILKEKSILPGNYDGDPQILWALLLELAGFMFILLLEKLEVKKNDYMAEKTRTLGDKILLFIKGVAMGAANKVPGVSGGLVAFVTGFYEELIYSLQKINRKALKLLIDGRFKSFYQYVNGRFLLLVFAGSTFSYFSVSRVLDYLIQNFELYVWATFFGMILGSIYYVAKDFNDFSRANIISMAVGVAIGVSISFMSPAKENDNLWFVFFCGIVGVSGMTLPGLSGSFILILMGNYALLLVDAVNELYKTIQDVFTFNFDFIYDEVRMRYMKIIASFGLGSVFGLVVTSHILGFLLKRWHQIITALIIGFIGGSLGNVWPWKREVYKMEGGEYLYDSLDKKIVENYIRYIPDFSDFTTWMAIFYVLIGIAILLAIDWYGEKNSKSVT